MILDAMFFEVARTQAAIAARLGCNPRTVVRAMPALIEARLVETVTIETGENTSISGWVKI
jgi:hypothetical protein